MGTERDAALSLVDRLGRPLRYVRISVTDRCDMRCVYCMPAEGVEFAPRSEVLTYEEIERIVQVLAPCGVWSVRITGGEPLVRRDVVELVRRITAVPGIEDVAMTTNGRLLPRYAGALVEAGLSRLNVSLDSIDRERFARITRGDHLPEVLAGIEAAVQAGLAPIKLNTVVVRGDNEQEVPTLVRFARAQGLLPRFIEIMPMGATGFFDAGRVAPSEELRQRLRDDGFEVEAITSTHAGNGPARYVRVREARVPGSPWSEVGFISPITENFCDACNRIRITSTGGLRACLGWDDSPSLRDLMRAGCTDDDLLRTVTASLRNKRDGHMFEADGSGQTDTTMSAVGG